MRQRKYYRENRSEIAPCIVSKASHALGIPNGYRYNRKKCSKTYWDEAINKIGYFNNIDIDKRIEAKNAYYNYML